MIKDKLQQADELLSFAEDTAHKDSDKITKARGLIHEVIYKISEQEDSFEDLQKLFEEFTQVTGGENLVELQNPRTKKFTLVDKSKGKIMGSYHNSLINNQNIK